MAEEAQELEVTHAGQPFTVDLLPAVSPVEVPQELTVVVQGDVTIDLVPASD